MKYSYVALLSSMVSLMSASPVLVTETDFLYQTVTVDADGNTVGAGTPFVTTVYAPKNVNNLVYVTTVINGDDAAAAATSSAAPAVETSSPAGQVVTVVVGGQSSSSSTPVAAAPSTLVVKSSAPAVESAAATSSAVPSSSGSGSSSGSLSTDAQALIDVHNKDRSQHQAGSMTWNETLAEYAQSYLNNQNCVFAHSGGPYGENIAMGYSSVTDAADAWYNEYKDYNYAAGQFGENTGHFTQMVWKSSTQLGCATVQCSGSTFLACEYYPRGNIIGQFLENVFD